LEAASSVDPLRSGRYRGLVTNDAIDRELDDVRTDLFVVDRSRSGWDDYAASVDSFVETLRNSPHRGTVLARWRKQQWRISAFTSVGVHPAVRRR
jgi:hypothetical protein